MSTTCRKWFRVGLVSLLVLGLGSANPLSVAKGGKPKPPPEPALQYVMTYVPIGVAGMNDAGDIVGSGIYFAETDAAYDLNVLFAGIVPLGATISGADDINDPVLGTCQIAGTFRSVDGWYYAYRGTIGLDEYGPIALDFTILPGQAYPRPANPDFHFHGIAKAINDRGDVVGIFEFREYDAETGMVGSLVAQSAILWPAEGGAVELCPLSSSSVALDINDAQQVTGWMLTDAGERHAYRYRPGTPPVLLDLGGLKKRPTSVGIGINSLGQVIGEATGPSYYARVIRYTDGVGMEELGNFFKSRYSMSRGVAINSSGQVVGRAYEYPGDVSAGFLYTDSAGFLDLATLISDPPPDLESGSIHPVAINDFPDHIYGQILVGTNLGGFVLRPNK